MMWVQVGFVIVHLQGLSRRIRKGIRGWFAILVLKIVTFQHAPPQSSGRSNRLRCFDKLGLAAPGKDPPVVLMRDVESVKTYPKDLIAASNHLRHDEAPLCEFSCVS